MQVAAAVAVAAAAAVDDEEGFQLWRRGERSMAVAAFIVNGGGGYG